MNLGAGMTAEVMEKHHSLIGFFSAACSVYCFILPTYGTIHSVMGIPIAIKNLEDDPKATLIDVDVVTQIRFSFLGFSG